MPIEHFIKLTDRDKPVTFTEYYSDGAAKFANSSQIIIFEDDVPAMRWGLNIVKLNVHKDEKK